MPQLSEQRKREFKKLEEDRKQEENRRKAEAEARSYSNLMSEQRMTTNRDGGNDSDDFMWNQMQRFFL